MGYREVALCIYSLGNGAGDRLGNRAVERESRALRSLKGLNAALESDEACEVVASGWPRSRGGKEHVRHLADLNL